MKGKKVFVGSRCPDLSNEPITESLDHFTLDMVIYNSNGKTIQFS